MDHEHELERERYRLCQLAFGLLSVALVLACVSDILALPRHFGGRPFLPWLVNSRAWGWLDVPVVWASLFGVYLLLGRWTEPGWQRRVGLLLVLCLADAVLWGIDHATELGLRPGDAGHLWFRYNLGQAMGWAEFALIASLTGDVLVHLGVEPAGETARATRSLAATGAAVWMLLFLVRTDWKRGWPLGIRRFASLEMLILDLGSTLIWTIALIQVSALALAATRRCGEVARELTPDERADHLFPRPSDDHFAALVTRAGEAEAF